MKTFRCCSYCEISLMTAKVGGGGGGGLDRSWIKGHVSKYADRWLGLWCVRTSFQVY